MIKAVIFDCFGVLVGRGFDETYRLAGGDPVKDREFIADVLGEANLGHISQDEFHERMTSQLGISLEEYEAAVAKAEQPNEELIEYINGLHEKYGTAVLSNVNKGVLERKIDSDILASHFDALILSGELGVAKPDPQIYELAAGKLGVEPSECVFTDDHQHYCEGAEAVGMKSILYKDFGQFKADLEQMLA